VIRAGIPTRRGDRALSARGRQRPGALSPGRSRELSRSNFTASVLWLVPAAGVEEPLWVAIAGVDPEAELVAVERLSAGLLRHAGG